MSAGSNYNRAGASVGGLGLSSALFGGSGTAKLRAVAENSRGADTSVPAGFHFGLGAGNDLLALKQVQGAKISKFSGNKADWERWQREWLEYLELISLGGEISEASKMWALMENVDSVTAQNWKSRKNLG
jgi:hypothetical protein